MSFFWVAFLFLVSFLIVALAQPDVSLVACLIASAVGYALFWKGLTFLNSKKAKFYLSFLWFGSIEIIHLGWFAADKYVGNYIYIVLILLGSVLGLLFAIFTRFIPDPKKMSLLQALALAGLWTLGEWGRLFVLSGYSWDPSGLALSASTLGMQMASLMGVFGLSFWVIFTNLLALQALSRDLRPFLFFRWLVVALIPFIFGGLTLLIHQKKMAEHNDTLSLVLVQTALYPEQKMNFAGFSNEAYHPLEQWKRVLTTLQPYLGKEIDLIAFPEAVVPYGTDLPIYTLGEAAKVFESVFQIPLSFDQPKSVKVGNAFFAQTIATLFNSDVVAGFEDGEYNAGFFFRPKQEKRERYEKRVLVPLGEYIPFKWCKKFLASYGIQDSFTPGLEAKVFFGKKIPLSVSICYEETYGHVMRESRSKGSLLQVNLTNDAWYPQSRLPLVHYFHGRLRSTELGCPIVRACNTGLTCGVDSLGRLIGSLEYERKGSLSSPGSLHLNLSTYTYPTLYGSYGDTIIVLLSFSFVFLYLVGKLIPFNSFNNLDSILLRKNKK